MKKFVLAALALSISSAYAANCGNDKPVGNADCNPGGGQSSTANAAALAVSTAGALAASISSGGSSTSNATAQGGNATGGVSAAVSGPSTSSVGNVAGGNATSGPSTSSVGNVAGGNATSGPSTSAGGSATVNITQAGQSFKNTPDANVLIASPTAVCRISFGMGGSGPGIGVSFGASMLDEGCDAREDARLLRNMGLHSEAILRLCAKAEMAAALGARCPAK